MGYILPITNYQYEQYTLREIGKKTNPYKQQEISRIFPINNRLQKETKDANENIFNHISVSHSNNQMHENKDISLLEAQLTGKGRNFHAFV
ncbi:hypothetical protein [Niallia sp. 01092]|uniref:hypothetical protein n=1 Tax=unclassified Niallia TaxID=2837522 RepID=UPI003FCF70BA